MRLYPYQRLIGALMYLAIFTRPDIAFVVNFFNQFNTNYSDEHWLAAKRILRYLKGTIDYGLMYRRSDISLLEWSTQTRLLTQLTDHILDTHSSSRERQYVGRPENSVLWHYQVWRLNMILSGGYQGSNLSPRRIT